MPSRSYRVLKDVQMQGDNRGRMVETMMVQSQNMGGGGYEGALMRQAERRKVMQAKTLRQLALKYTI